MTSPAVGVPRFIPACAGNTRSSSARIWGRSWFIPACAGNTTHHHEHVSTCAVHPRLRGEHIVQTLPDASVIGSSPPARGTQKLPDAAPIVARFIPACAGNTLVYHGPDLLATVHPRLRGEHQLAWYTAMATYGSSPPARGTPHPGRCPCVIQRFIPACAGNTDGAGQARLPRHRTVHPRLRGEHAAVERKGIGEFGSSPPARGTPVPMDYYPLKHRFIPACAGNTAEAMTISSCRSVHPRLRGEHAFIAVGDGGEAGSSPPARGTRVDVVRAGVTERFIPACAGNTPGVVPSLDLLTVHPRLRGEHPSCRGIARFVIGSSPPARGTRQRPRAPIAAQRFIPACAGNTSP